MESGSNQGVVEVIGMVEVKVMVEVEVKVELVEVVLVVARHRPLGLLSHMIWTQKVGLLTSAHSSAIPQIPCLLPWVSLLLNCSL